MFMPVPRAWTFATWPRSRGPPRGQDAAQLVVVGLLQETSRDIELATAGIGSIDCGSSRRVTRTWFSGRGWFMFLMRGVITRWRRSAWRASILRLLGAGCRLAVGSPALFSATLRQHSPPAEKSSSLPHYRILQQCPDMVLVDQIYLALEALSQPPFRFCSFFRKLVSDRIGAR